MEAAGRSKLVGVARVEDDEASEIDVENGDGSRLEEGGRTDGGARGASCR